MKILCIFRDSFDAKYLLSELDRHKISADVIIETGGNAKRKKLKKYFNLRKLYLWPVRFLDLSAILIYSTLFTKRMEKRMGVFSYPSGYIRQTVNDVNDPECILSVTKIKPDILFIFGTGIVSKEFIKHVDGMMFNIHTGILPEYRNVHSDFWAYMKRDFERIGVSVIYLDEGVDTGDIAIQQSLSLEEPVSLTNIKVKNLELCSSLLLKIINSYKNGKLKRVKQVHKKKGYFKTPGFIDLIKLIR